LILAAAMTVAILWCNSASAQYGGQSHDPNEEIEAARSRQKAQAQKYARGSASRARPTFGGSGADPYGRIDMSGRAVPGYPAIRGDLRSNPVRRGGANGVARSRRR
jgi:hypothetical protein